MTKSEARILYKDKRLSLAVMQRDKLEDLILIEFQKLNLSVPDFIMTYAGNEKLMEYDPHLVERFCHFKNPLSSFAYPKIKDQELQAFLVNENTTFIANKFGIDEPANGSLIDVNEIEMVFVPLLAFDLKGYRVGYGKGYYDKFLSKAGNELIKIGFSFFEAEERIVDVDKYDIPLDICITPFKTYHF